jgi:hypothetical protein
MGVADVALRPAGWRCDKGRIRQRRKALVIYALMLIPSPTNKADHLRICRALASTYMRIADMRAAAQLELGRIDELNDQLGPDLKTHLSRVSVDLRQILRGLGPITFEEAYTPRQMAKWLDGVERALARAIQQRLAFVAAHMRIADMRTTARLERGRMHELNAQNSGDMKADLKSVADDLMTVLRWLGPLSLREAHTPLEMAKWLDGVDGVLQRAIQRSKAVEVVVKKRGAAGRPRSDS